MKMTVALALVCVTVGLSVAQESDAAIKQYDLNIPRQTLDTALKDLAQQTGLQIARFTDNGHGSAMVGPVQGAVTAETALDSLLAPTGLTYRVVNDRTIAVMAPGSGTPVAAAGSAEGEGGSDPGNARTAGAVRIAQNQTGVQQSQASQPSEKESEREKRLIEEIVVTGTNIRGVTNPASPVRIFDRGAIDQSGQSTIPDFLQTLPQTFLGSSTDFATTTPGSGSGNNLSLGSGVDLRGLGSDSTLILLNGKRLAPGSVGNYVDVSSIPLSAVERIDVVTDGASAIYGSDAVGGVINIILMDDYSGAETSIRYGSVTDGDSEEFNASQLFGANWDSGNALITYEYFNQTPLSNRDRSFTENATGDFFLAPEQEQHSVFFAAAQEITPSIKLTGTGNYSDRDASSSSFSAAGQSTTDSFSEQYGGTLGLEMDFGSSWFAELYGLYSKSSTDHVLLVPALNFELPTDFVNEIWSLETKAIGPIFSLPGGESQLAIGGGFRKEKFEDALGFTRSPTASERDVYYTFGEVLLPIVGETNARPGLKLLEFSLAGRFEDYSDAGSSTDGKVGIVWSPFNGFVARGTYGTSFRAPNFFEQPPGIGQLVFINVPDPLSPSGTSLLLSIAGAPSVSLKPEQAETWTAGFDFQPEQLTGLNVSLTYFDIDFTDRIAVPSANIFTFLGDPVFDSIIQRNPTVTDVEAVLATPNVTSFFDFSGIPDEALRNSSVDVISDLRTANLTSIRTSGFDFSLGYSRDTEVGNIGVRIAGSYLTRQEEKLTATSSAADFLNTFRNPVDLRLRNSVTWANNGWKAGIVVNYTDSYTNDAVDPVQAIDSFTTVDLTLSYDTKGRIGSERLHNIVLRLSVLNIFDEDAPFVEDSFGRGINFDAQNANPLGRFISFQVTKGW